MLSKSTSRMILLRSIALGHDFSMAAMAFLLSLLLRLGADNLAANWVEYLTASFFFSATVSMVSLAFGMNRGVWRYASISDLVAILKTVTLSIALFVVAQFLLTRLQLTPRSIVFTAWAFTVVLLASPRAAYRIYRNNRASKRKWTEFQSRPKRVLLVGANDNADLFVKAISESNGPHYQVVAIIDERGRRTGRIIRGVPVVGGPEDLPKLVDQFEQRNQRPEAIILTREREEYQRYASIERLIELAASLKLEMLRLPNLSQIPKINADLEVRPIALEDLLQRPAIQHDAENLGEMIGGRKVLITGAGGSIGSELVRQIVALVPAKLILADASEYLLYSIESELIRSGVQVPVSALLCNVRERGAIDQLIKSERPEIVFHAAALKHVPIVELQPLEGLATNTIGTRNVADACQAAGVKAMIMISTDKAVRPANVMGASKRLAEMYCQALDVQSGKDGTRFVTVRFGNVLGSAGSVVPLFEKQLKAGGPLTVTHPDIERYFMTIPEACLLVLQAAAHAWRSMETRGRIFVLDMGTPVKIADLARNIIRLSGLRPDVDVRIVYTGLRPGEKLYEELFASRERLVETGTSHILAAFPRPVDAAMISRIFHEMDRLVSSNDVQGAIRLLRSTVVDFSPASVEQGPQPAGTSSAEPSAGARLN